MKIYIGTLAFVAMGTLCLPLLAKQQNNSSTTNVGCETADCSGDGSHSSGGPLSVSDCNTFATIQAQEIVALKGQIGDLERENRRLKNERSDQ